MALYVFGPGYEFFQAMEAVVRMLKDEDWIRSHDYITLKVNSMNIYSIII